MRRKPGPLSALLRRQRGKASQRDGEAAEVYVGGWLAARFRMVERVRVGWKVRRGPGGRILDAWPLEPVSGDWRAVGTGGQSVLVEVKRRPVAERLDWSDLEAHQHDGLRTHAVAGGLSLVAWVATDAARIIGLAVLLYPVSPAMLVYWHKGKACTWEDARAATLP
jgi:hypothetical protein